MNIKFGSEGVKTIYTIPYVEKAASAEDETAGVEETAEAPKEEAKKLRFESKDGVCMRWPKYSFIK